MKGVIFNSLEAFVVEGFGAAAWEAILERVSAEAAAVKVGPGSYPDAQLFELAQAVADHAKLPLPDALRAFGAYLFKALERAAPTLIGQFDSAPALLKGIDDVIHVEVKKLMRDAYTPTILVVDRGHGQMELSYRSSRKLCVLLEGLLDGLGAHFGVTIERRQRECMHEGAGACLYELNVVAVERAA